MNLPAATRAGAKRVLARWLPAPAGQVLLKMWRTLYWRTRAWRLRAGNRPAVRRLLAADAPIWLELGSWRRDGMPGWSFSDLGGGGDLALDLTEPLPFPDATVQRLYSSHVLEHFGYPEPMLSLLRECHRVLVPGGSLSLAVPDARYWIAGYLDPESFDRERFCDHDVGLHFRTPMDILNYVAHLGGEHRHLFDEHNLLDVLREAGFDQVCTREFDERLDRESRRHESVYAVAIK